MELHSKIKYNPKSAEIFYVYGNIFEDIRTCMVYSDHENRMIIN